MKPKETFCILCGDDPCTCITTTSRRRKAAPKAEPTPATTIESRQVEQQPGTRSEPRRVQSSTEGVGEHDIATITAVRALAHIVKNREDLAEYEDYLLESDFLDPDERIDSWRRRIGSD